MSPTRVYEGEYRQYLPDLSTPRFTTMQKQDAHEYARDFKEGGKPPWLHALYQHWLKLYKEPYRGVTVDGKVRPGLFTLQDDGIPIEDIVDAANNLLSKLDATQRARIVYHVESPEWRTWSNPEFLLSDKGIRLDEVSEPVREAAMGVLKATLSPEGYAKAVAAMRVNGFLGELVGSPAVMNEFSYNVALFGEPRVDRPWGFTFYGHHLCLNAFLFRRQLVMAPWFTGAEPNLIDAGPHAGTRLFADEERLGLAVMRGLDEEARGRARTYVRMRDPAMPRGRWNRDDQRHLCGAYRDNRVVAPEGVVVADMPPAQQDGVAAVLEAYLAYLPQRARAAQLAEARRRFDETWFSWIGGDGDDDAFYYRVQGPTLLVEFDHHSGVFLTNEEPARFHVHTLLRMPNAGDYGMALRDMIAEEVRKEEQGFTWEGEPYVWKGEAEAEVKGEVKVTGETKMKGEVEMLAAVKINGGSKLNGEVSGF